MLIIQTTIKLGRKYPFIKKFILPFYNVLRWINHRRHKVIKEVDGIMYELDLNQLIDSRLYFTGSWELETVQAIKKILKPGDVVIDIGANIGCHALLCAKIVGQTGKVIAFEPTMQAYKKLFRNKELNSHWCQNLLLKKIVLSNQTIKAQSVRINSSWQTFGIKSPPGEEIIDFITLDDYIYASDLQKINLVKIDVDGYEYKIICGAMKTLTKYKPALILELGSYTLAGVGDRLTDLVDTIFQLNYQIISEQNGYVFKNTAEVIKAVPDDATINVICLPNQECILASEFLN